MLELVLVFYCCAKVCNAQPWLFPIVLTLNQILIPFWNRWNVTFGWKMSIYGGIQEEAMARNVRGFESWPWKSCFPISSYIFESELDRSLVEKVTLGWKCHFWLKRDTFNWQMSLDHGTASHGPKAFVCIRNRLGKQYHMVLMSLGLNYSVISFWV